MLFAASSWGHLLPKAEAYMVDDKIRSRVHVPAQILTRQPTEGWSRYFGPQFGEMERDCIIAHGATHFLKERLFDHSDAYRVHGCERCGLIAIANLKANSFEYRSCKNIINIVKVTHPFLFPFVSVYDRKVIVSIHK